MFFFIQFFLLEFYKFFNLIFHIRLYFNSLYLFIILKIINIIPKLILFSKFYYSIRCFIVKFDFLKIIFHLIDFILLIALNQTFIQTSFIIIRIHCLAL